jgi:WhiB family transcriptional regulator, redox-sensing transcriptional regulator
MWDHAACRDMDTSGFFADPGERAAVDRAKLVCDGCSIRERCLEYALASGIGVGVWGGLDAQERLALAHRRNGRGIGRPPGSHAPSLEGSTPFARRPVRSSPTAGGRR